MGASYWRQVAGRGPRRMDSGIQEALICPDDDAPLEASSQTGQLTCPHCNRRFSQEGGYLDILPSRELYALSAEEIAGQQERLEREGAGVDADPAEVFGACWEAAERLLGDVSGKLILDACCGSGFVARSLAERGARVVALDVAGGARGLDGLARWRRDRTVILEITRADMCRIPFQSATFDFILIGGALAGMRRPERCVIEASRVLRDGGQVLVLGETVGPRSGPALQGGDPRAEGRALSFADYAGIFAEGRMSIEAHFADAGPPAHGDGPLRRLRHHWRSHRPGEPRLLAGRHKQGFQLPALPLPRGGNGRKEK